MSLINEYRATEEAIKKLQSRLNNLSNDDRLKKELEFEGKLRELMGEYQKSLRDIIVLLDPDSKSFKAPQANTGTKQRKERVVKTYKNPLTEEVIQTKGGNHKILKEWKAEHGAEEVESWIVK